MLRLAAGAVVLDRYQIFAAPTYTDARGLVAPAFDPHLGRRVDLVLAPEPVGTPAGDLFARRAHAVALLRHEALPLLMDMGCHRGHIVLAYRPAEGRSLAGATVQGTEVWSVRRALETIAHLASALGLAHAHGLCDGSFSARSVLIESDGTAAILDLACPRPAAALDRDELAPEVRRGAAPTPRSDVFALGQMLRRLMRLTDREAERALRGAAWEVARHASARAPRERYADGAAMAREIARLLEQPRASHALIYPALPGAASRPTAVAPMSMAPRRQTPLTAASHRPPNRAAQRRASAIASALAVSLAIGLLPLASIVAHDTLHRPFVGIPWRGDGDGWRSGGRAWGQDQPPPWPQWRPRDPDQPWPPGP